MDDIRELRNKFTHYKKTKRRIKYKYLGVSLLTKVSIINIVVDSNFVFLKLKKLSMSKDKWEIM